MGDGSRSGIYVLEFANGELYVGQTISLLRRIADHRRHWGDDIRAVRFAAVSSPELDQAERDVLARLVSTGSRVRNIASVALPLRSDALDLVVDPTVVASWLDMEGDLEIGNRGRQSLQRRNTEAQHRILMSHPSHAAVVGSLARYVATCLPRPHLTEGRFWTVTSMPTTGKTSSWHRLAALSVNNVEVLVFGEAATKRGWRHQGFMNVANSSSMARVVSRGRVELANYRTVGDVQRIWFDSPERPAALLGQRAVMRAARTLAVGLLRKGNGLFGRFHDYNLADEIFATLATYGDESRS